MGNWDFFDEKYSSFGNMYCPYLMYNHGGENDDTIYKCVSKDAHLAMPNNRFLYEKDLSKEGGFLCKNDWAECPAYNKEWQDKYRQRNK